MRIRPRGIDDVRRRFKKPAEMSKKVVSVGKNLPWRSDSLRTHFILPKIYLNEILTFFNLLCLI